MTETTAPSVSVVVPVFRDAERLASCLSRLADQRSPLPGGYEVIVVDNDPVEGTPSEPVAEVTARFPGFRVSAQPRPGSYAARNLGVSLARGRVIAFTDADCLPSQGWLEAGVTHLIEDDAIGIVGGPVELLLADPQHPRLTELVQIVTAFRQREFVEEQGYCATANLFTRRSVFELAGPFEEGLLSRGDWEWARRVAAAGFRLVYSEAARVSHPASGSVRGLMRRTARIAGGGWALQRMGGDGTAAARPGSRAKGEPTTGPREVPSDRAPVGGRARWALLGTIGRWAQAAWRLLIPSRELALVRAAPCIASTPQCLAVGGLIVLLSWYGLFERLRLMLGGSPERR